MTQDDDLRRRLTASTKGLQLSEQASTAHLAALADPLGTEPIERRRTGRHQLVLSACVLIVLASAVGFLVAIRGGATNTVTITNPPALAPADQTPVPTPTSTGSSLPTTTARSERASPPPTETRTPPSDATTGIAPMPTSASLAGPSITGSSTLQPSTIRPSVTQPSTTQPSTLLPIGEQRWFLAESQRGDHRSSPSLPLRSTPPSAGDLANYDTERDDGPGLLIKRDGAGLSTNDPTKRQDWTWTIRDRFIGERSAELTIALAASDFHEGETIGAVAELSLCKPSCERIASGSWTGTATTSFQMVTIDMGSIDEAADMGDVLRLRIAAADHVTTTDIWLGYDTAAYPASLTLG